MRRFDHLPKLLPPTLATLLVLACGGDTPTGPPPPPVAETVTPAMTVAQGDGAVATVTQVPTQVPTVRLTDSHGKPARGVIVTFTPDTASGSVAQPTATTDTLGVASSGAWTLGTRAGAQRLTASATVDGTALAATFNATAVADRPALATIVSGGAQDGPFGASLATPMAVKVTDRYGNANPGITVHFSIDSGALIGGTTPTTAAGVASVRVRLPRTTGAAVVTASVDSLPTMQSTFTSRGIRFASFSLYNGDACGLSTEGYGYCWGTNALGELVALGASAAQQQVTTPQPISGDFDFTAISLENYGGCALETDGTAMCWGNNVYGANGNGGTSPTLEPMTPVTGGLKFAEIHRGPVATCGTTTTGQSYCWGLGGTGQLGSATYFRTSVTRPVAVDGGITFHGYAMGPLHTCALDPSGQAYCWGADWHGQLGIPSGRTTCDHSITTPDTTIVLPGTCEMSPVAVGTSAKFKSLATTSSATCGLTGAGDVYCWGSNSLGALATGDTISTSTPTRVASLPALTQLSGGTEGFCGLTTGGDIYCWGSGLATLGASDGQCASGDCATTPVRLPTGRTFSSITAISNDICGLSSGVAYCWGANNNGALGNGTPGGSTTTPTAVAGQTP